MPRYAYQKPRAKVYAYNYGYMNNYYKPMTHYLSKEGHLLSDRPGAQSLAERLKKFPMDGSIYPDKDVEYLPSIYPPREFEREVAPSPPRMEPEDEPMPEIVIRAPREQYQQPQEYEPEKKVAPLYLRYPRSRSVGVEELEKKVAPWYLRYPRSRSVEVEEPEKKVVPLYLKHPYRLPVEDEIMRRPLLDPVWFRRPWDWECIWVPPHESQVTPHFGVESCYKLITRFLRLKPLEELVYCP